jgi:VanZ family protein
MLWFRSKIFKYIWLILFCAVVIESLIPYGSPEINNNYSDILLHLLCFFVLAFLPVYDSANVLQGLYLALLVAIIGSGLELLQLFLPGRDCSPVDIFTNNIGVVLGVLVGAIVRFFKRKTKVGKQLESNK